VSKQRARTRALFSFVDCRLIRMFACCLGCYLVRSQQSNCWDCCQARKGKSIVATRAGTATAAAAVDILLCDKDSKQSSTRAKTKHRHRTQHIQSQL
jgi:hypothetical protein